MPYGRFRRNKRRNYKNNRRRYNRLPRRRFNRYRRRGFKPITKINRTITGISDRYITKLNYTDFLDMTSAVPEQNFAYRGNSIFDPDFTGGGTQPLGRDQWATFYNKYKVHACKIQVVVAATATTSGSGNMIVNVTPNVGTGIAPSSRTIFEWADAAYNSNKLLTPVSAGGNPLIIRKYMTTKKIYGDKILDDEYGANMGSNPIKQWFWVLNWGTIDGASTTGGFAKIRLTYFVEFYDRIQLTSS